MVDISSFLVSLYYKRGEVLMVKDQKDYEKHIAYNKFVRENKIILRNPVVQSFLKHEKNYRIFLNAITYPTKINEHKLDVAFRNYYYETRLIKYLSTLIHFYTIQSVIKYRKHFIKHLYILNKTTDEEQDYSNI